MNPATKEYCKAFVYTAVVVLLAAVALAAVSCSLEEWRDVAHDAVSTAPGEAVDLLTDTDADGNVKFEKPNEADYTNAAVSFITGLASGWYARKFKEKRYKAKSGDVGS